MNIISRDEDCLNIDACVKNKWNWHWLERSVTVDVKKLLRSSTWDAEKLLRSSTWDAGNLTFYVGESIRKVWPH